MKIEFEKSQPFEFRSIQKTPWGGFQIPELKKKYFPKQASSIPDRIGESFEIRVKSLLIKWIDALEPLSIQVHPHYSYPNLKQDECGKHEAWYVYKVKNPSPIFLGFKEDYSKNQIIECLKSNSPLDCLYSFVPQPNSYISIPPGCVHSLGSGTFIAEPQYLLENKDGKTLRIFDWNRLYNLKGDKDDLGNPRELHTQEALNVIDWNLPCGKEIEHQLVKKFEHNQDFEGNKYNPFMLKAFLQEDNITFKPSPFSDFSLLTVFAGKVTIKNIDKTIELHGGESMCLPNTNSNYHIKIIKYLDEQPCALIFALNKNFL